MGKTPVTYRLTDQCRDQVQEAAELLRKRYAAEGMEYLVHRVDRTAIIHKAVAYYLDYLKKGFHQEEVKQIKPRSRGNK